MVKTAVAISLKELLFWWEISRRKCLGQSFIKKVFFIQKLMSNVLIGAENLGQHFRLKVKLEYSLRKRFYVP